jgi:acetyl/propionyl-CoA carboxylase alpha subunit
MTLLARNKAAPRRPADDRVWKHPGIAGQIARAEFFDAEPAVVETVYIGPSSRAVRYLGTRLDAQLYLGAKALFP